MARKGPRPKPTHLKVIEGNPGKRALPKHEPQPDPDRPYAPSWLTDDAKTAWRYLAPILHDAGLLTRLDRYTLAVLCEEISQFVEAVEYRKRGILVAGQRKGDVKKNPALQAQRDAARLISTYSRMFGLSPADRATLEGAAASPTGNAALALSRVLSGELEDA